jgi:uncharacterized membrane protein
MRLWLLCFLLVASVYAHEGHIAQTEDVVKINAGEGGRPHSWAQWIGGFHLIILHFPIALINMLVVAEWIWIFSASMFFDNVSKFLLWSSAFFSLPTALLGLLYSTSFTYGGVLENYLNFHMWLGIATAVLAILLVFLRGKSSLYYWGLGALFVTVNLAGYFGGALVFGPNHMEMPL